MCGIVGYLGKREAFPILIAGLKRLEYRGYDSAGVALLSSGKDLRVYKEKGKVANLEQLVAGRDLSGTIGIAHTRWATHGEPSEVNAHPHLSQSGRLALVHNGIIENYSALRESLREKGFTFRSSTDTEVLVQLIEYIQQKYSTDLPSAVRISLNKIVGAYAIAVIDREEPDMIVAARKSSPLVVGIGEDNKEFFIASDASPIADYTSQMVYLDDGEIVTIRRGKPIQVINLNNETIDPKIEQVEMDFGKMQKGDFPHFMLKEIFDQPDCIEDCMRGRLLTSKKRIVLSALQLHHKELVEAKRITIISCGTSWHAGLIGKQLLESYCRIPVNVEYASEFRYSNPVIGKGDVVIAISQSGETADTLAAIQLAKEKGAYIFGIVNAVGSSIARAASMGTYIHVGPEIGVASTKAFTGQVTVLTLLSLAIGRERGTIDPETYQQIVTELANIPDKIRKVLKSNEHIEEISKMFTYAKNFIYLGRGYNYPVALEGALKLKEISYIHAEGYPAAEMKHGPIALIDADMPVVCIATDKTLYPKTVSNIQEIKARHGHIIAIVPEGDVTIHKIADDVIEVPETLTCLTPLLSTIPLQLLAYHIAVRKDLNVDQPRNLAKSVTVE
ncbi:MAG: glutamine--fructose-6-phosphate transaminase (isomerizing) [Muribaculaceae bacterium]|jgi:glucosamine--fructose-6-phosphate aminotransferase (isomerizing)|nr:glutamine--fructose-6-phosphate transaminase (isomerizing) [Muribaculaceae bacterium]